MDILLVKILFLIALLVGVFGSILPILPGAPLSFAALLVAKIFGFSELSWWVIALFGVLTIVGIILDYLIPVVTTKRMGGSKYGIIGLIIGFIVGVVFSPFGFVSIILAPFFGALIGELIYDQQNPKRALKSAAGSIIGYALTSGYGLILTLSMFAVYLFFDIIYLLFWVK